MKKPKLTPERLEYFNDNFDKDTIDEALQSIRETITGPDIQSFLDIRHKFGEILVNVDYPDGDTVLMDFEFELDSSKLKSKADILVLSVEIGWSDKLGRAWLSTITLYTDDNLDSEVLPICKMSPDTYQIIRWMHPDV